jgi:predicted ribosome quality control (RQC) complex YloA/Tae2 family protein
VEITRQIEEARGELRYIDAVLDSLSRAETESDLDELREELSLWGYGKRDKKSLKIRDNKKKPKPLHFISPSGLDVFVGKNNLQNDYITMKLGEKNDWWFHVKNAPGSHVLMRVTGEEPPAEDFTFAATLAARDSSAEGDNIAVDYTLIRHIKKPPQSKPGFVTYSTYWTAYVTV